MAAYHFDHLLQNDGWKQNVLVKTDIAGRITHYEENAPVSDAKRISGYALPGFQNAHSHAFQYAMAGLAEIHSGGNESDDFWSWRNAMYQLALSIDPEDLEAIAAMLYSEMVRNGYTNVAEFHYVHHDKNGKAYSNPAEMGSRLLSAAEQAGINITLIPIFYQKGGFGKDPLEGQKRFISHNLEQYLSLLDASSKICAGKTFANVAVGIHSMRGVEPKIIAEIAKNGPQDLPFHIHIAEQLKEIEDSINYLGKRPVEWFLENIGLNDRFHLVHATHLTPEETSALAATGANVVLCPTTEGNLGDGIFPLNSYQKYGGAWSIGTDSHIGINPFEELRLLDYGQRLITHKRHTYAGEEGDSGKFALEMSCISGRKAMNNFENRFFTVGASLNACVLSAENPLLSTSSDRTLTSTLLYTADASKQNCTIANGEVVVAEGRHSNYESISKRFTTAMRKLGNRL